MPVAARRRVEFRSSDPALARHMPRVAEPGSVQRSRPDAVTSVELIWRVPPPVLPVPRGGVLVSPLAMPSMQDLAAVARHVGAASSLAAGVAGLQRDIRKYLRVSDAMCIWIDWPRRLAHSLEGRLGEQVRELVTAVAGSGRRSLVGNALVEPLGPPPTRAVLALRKPSGTTFDASELTVIRTLAAGIAPALDRLIAASRADHA